MPKVSISCPVCQDGTVMLDVWIDYDDFGQNSWPYIDEVELLDWDCECGLEEKFFVENDSVALEIFDTLHYREPTPYDLY